MKRIAILMALGALFLTACGHGYYYHPGPNGPCGCHSQPCGCTSEPCGCTSEPCGCEHNQFDLFGSDEPVFDNGMYAHRPEASRCGEPCEQARPQCREIEICVEAAEKPECEPCVCITSKKDDAGVEYPEYTGDYAGDAAAPHCMKPNRLPSYACPPQWSRVHDDECTLF